MTTTYDSISVERVAQTEWITFQRTKQMNALSSQMLDETANALDVAMACDLVFAAQSAKMGDAHSNFGVFPGAGGAAILPNRIGLNRAKDLLFSGENVTSQQMMDWGLVNRVVADDDLRDAVQTYADKLSDKSPAVLRRMKTMANRAMNTDEQSALAEEMLHLLAHMRSWDMQEGLSAFAEKRKPKFRGY